MSNSQKAKHSNLAAQGGEAQITRFDIYSNYTPIILDVGSGVVDFSYYESVLDNTVRSSALIVDTGIEKEGKDRGLSQFEWDFDPRLHTNRTVGEKAVITVIDGYGYKLEIKEMRIDKTRAVEETTLKMSYSIDMVSKEYIDNELEENRVKQRFDGLISDSIEDILKNNLKTEKEIETDKSLNKLSFIGNVEKPFYKCTWLGPRTVPDIPKAYGNYAGYFFYETNEGYKFKSIDNLFFSQEPRRKLIYNETVELPPGYDAKILDYKFHESFNLKNSMITASQMIAQLKGVNSYESSYRETQFESQNQFNEENTGALEQPRIASDLKIQEKPTRISYKWDDPGFIVEGKKLLDQLPKSTYKNYDNDNILRQSYMRYNNLFSVVLSITIPGDLSLRAGQLVHCDFPEVSSKDFKIVSIKKSGIYMIADVCHRVTSTGCYSRLNLVRETIKKK